MAKNNTTNLLDGLLAAGLISEVTGRDKLRLFGLPHVAPLRRVIVPSRRPIPGRGRGRPRTLLNGAAALPQEPIAGPAQAKGATLGTLELQFDPLPPPEFDFAEFDRFMAQAEAATAHKPGAHRGACRERTMAAWTAQEMRRIVPCLAGGWFTAAS
jgi:hypothetical protein